ncbi:MAG: hypothetical protein RL662_1837 [Bacteroidota bacterium]|jgi:nicotinate-nucleotide adenylyltransferase
MNIGIFSGSFNPIHIGHLVLANYITEYTSLDEVWLLVTPHNPLKNNVVLLDESLRLEMCRLALNDFPKIKISDIEFRLARPSYTIDTLRALDDQYPQHTFSLIVGADNWAIFDKWKNHTQIIDKYKLYVYPRLGHSVEVANEWSERVEILDSPIIEISSTFIRQGLYEGKNMRAFLPQDVYEFIQKNKLYQ